MWILVVLILGAGVSFVALQQFRGHLFANAQVVAETMARSLDALLLVASEDLGRLSDELESLDAAAAPKLRAARFHSLFGAAIHLVSAEGEVLATDPPSAPPPPSDWLEAGHGISELQPRGAPGAGFSVAMLVPFERGGREYFIVAEMSAVGSRVGSLLREISQSRDLEVAVLDGSARVVAASAHDAAPSRIDSVLDLEERVRDGEAFVTTIGRCVGCAPGSSRDGSFLTAVAPLEHAPWAVVVQEPKRTAFAPLTTAELGLIGAVVLLLLLGLPLNRTLVTTVVEPLTRLSRRATRLQEGDLETPVVARGDREIETLAAALDDARRQLSAHMEELRRLNEGLEDLVAERTEALERRVVDLELLSGILGIAAEERSTEIFAPRALDLMLSTLPLEAVGLVAIPPDGLPRRFAAPDEGVVPWLGSDRGPPEGWRIRWLAHQGETLGRLYYQWTEEPDEAVMNGVQRAMAQALHGAFLFEHTVEQDSRRRALVRRLLSAGEEERRRIARELHDEIAQLLTAVRLSLGEVSEYPGLDRAREILSRTQTEIHRIIHDLRPSLLDDLGLPAAVRSWATSRLAAAGIDVHVEIDEDLELDEEIEIAAYRIYQEIVTNVLRHSEAESASIELFRDGDDLVLVVEDDGVGFAPREKTSTTGILGMRERAALVDGRLDIDSEPGTGTVVSVRIPIPGREEVA